MKLLKNHICIVFIFLFCDKVFSQGFINLNFENATIVPDSSSPFYPYAVYANEAIPGWTVSGVTVLPTNEIFYNALSTGSAAVTLLDTNAPYGSGALVIDGKYSINLYNGASISQTGVIPLDTESVLFDAEGNPSLGLLTLSIGGENISLVPISSGANYTLYGANIPTGFDGQNESLMFSTITGESNWTLDDIQFSPNSVPEPSLLALYSLGGTLLVWQYRRKFYRNKV